MWLRQSRDTFIRQFDDIGIISNQLTKRDRIYDDVGAIYLSKIGRQPRCEADIVTELATEFSEVATETLAADLREFIENLEADGFVLTGESPTEIDGKEPAFSYRMENPKTMPVTNFCAERSLIGDTTDFMEEHFHQHPHIFSLQMEVTSRCNEHCRHCYLPPNRAMCDLETRIALDILDQLMPLGTLSLTISGGECFLHKDIDQILRRARKNDLSISILSNITLLTDDHIALLKEVNIAQVQVSLYSMKADEHDWITQLPGSHVKTLRSLERLVAADVPTQISCPVLQLNRNSYRGVMAWAYQHRIKAYTDFIMMARTDFSSSNLNHRLSRSEAEDFMRGMLEYDQEYMANLEVKPQLEDAKSFENKPVCGIGVDSINLAANGAFYPCSGFQGIILGDAYKESLKSIWDNSPAIRKLRQITNANLPDCIGCAARQFCSRCLARNFNENGGDMFKVSSHFCDIAFLNKKIVDEYWQHQAATAK